MRARRSSDCLISDHEAAEIRSIIKDHSLLLHKIDTLIVEVEKTRKCSSDTRDDVKTYKNYSRAFVFFASLIFIMMGWEIIELESLIGLFFGGL